VEVRADGRIPEHVTDDLHHRVELRSFRFSKQVHTPIRPDRTVKPRTEADRRGLPLFGGRLDRRNATTVTLGVSTG
jgi:hypothetical protein